VLQPKPLVGGDFGRWRTRSLPWCCGRVRGRWTRLDRVGRWLPGSPGGWRRPLGRREGSRAGSAAVWGGVRGAV